MANITPKQEQVLAALGKGRTVDQVAKSMKISKSGVYGHIRRMREMGVEVPGASAERPGQSALAHANGGARDVSVKEFIESAIATEQAQLVVIKEEAATHRAKAEALEKQTSVTVDEIAKYDRALEALA